jgi:hypothetical protein
LAATIPELRSWGAGVAGLYPDPISTGFWSSLTAQSEETTLAPESRKLEDLRDLAGRFRALQRSAQAMF